VTVRIGIIGTGGISRSHLVNLVCNPDVEVVGLCDIVAEQIDKTRQVVNRHVDKETEAGRSAKKLDAAAYSDYREMLRKEHLDGVYLCLPPYVHGDPEEAVIEAGIPVLIEKPVTLELPLAARILDGIRRKGLINASGYQLRYSPQIAKAKEILSGKTIGMAVAMRFGGTPGTPWYTKQSTCGGQLVEQATHHVDQLRYLVGEVETVYASAALRINNKDNPEYDIFDVNCMTMAFANGVTANFANSLISGYGTPPEARGVHVFADGVTVSLPLGRPLRVISAEGTQEFPDSSSPMALEDAAFVEAIKTGDASLIKSDYLSGIRTLAVTIAGERSARTGKPVNVPALLEAEAPNAALTGGK
jgi:myo-inositol 2-dehydrogenase/D-chiro-inositol 1-dehydrogenase